LSLLFITTSGLFTLRSSARRTSARSSKVSSSRKSLSLRLTSKASRIFPTTAITSSE